MNRIDLLQGIGHQVTETIIAVITAPLGGHREIEHPIVMPRIHCCAAAHVRRTGGRINGGTGSWIQGQQARQNNDSYFLSESIHVRLIHPPIVQFG